LKKLVVFGLVLAVVIGLTLAVGADSHEEDNIYIGFSEFSRGFVEARVTLENDDIISVDLLEYNDMGELKDEDYRLDEWHEAMEALPGRFLEANSAEIDVYTGATSTSEKAMAAVEMALQKAEGVEQFDGTFMGLSEVEDNSWNIAIVTIEEGEITAVELEEVSDGELKDEDYRLDEWHEARIELPDRFVEANSAEVDTFTGATGSSERWIEAVTDALAKAGL